MKIRVSIAILIALAATSLTFAQIKLKSYDQSSAEKEFVAAADTASTFTTQVGLAKQFRAKSPDDFAVQMRASSILMMDDPQATQKHYADRAAQNPKSEADLYFAGRLSESLADKQSYTAKLFDLNSQSYWAFLLQATSYNAEDDADFQKAESSLKKAIEKDASLPYAPTMLAELWARQGKTAEADQVLVELAKQSPEDFQPVQRRLMLYPGQFSKHIEIINDYLKHNERSALAYDLHARVNRELKDWDGYISSMQKAVAIQPDAINHYNLACGFSLTGATDSAYAHLFEAAKNGLNDAEQYTEDEDLIPVKSDARWVELLAAVEKGHADQMREMQAASTRALMESQKEQVTQRESSTDAADFDLEQMSGGTVKLSDLRGKVVVLDFWATWCGPCKMTMPLLNQFYTDGRAEDVLLFGVNVWERGGREPVQKFVESKGYKFPILYGTNELAESYGVRGIPTMFVIDKDGKIAHRHVGYNPQIIQILKAQTEALLK
jgi:thiol-disulfide isomerase/thioredoxin